LKEETVEVIVMASDIEKIFNKRNKILKEIRDQKWEVTQLNQKLNQKLHKAIYELNVLSKYEWKFNRIGYGYTFEFTAIIPENDEWSLLNLIPSKDNDDCGYDHNTIELIKGELSLTAYASSRNTKGHVIMVLGCNTVLKTIQDLKLKVFGDYTKSISECQILVDNYNQIVDILKQLDKLG
jgi:hypothetical protein